MQNQSGSTQFDKAYRLHMQGRRAEALAAYRTLVRTRPNHLDGQYMLGTLYAEMRNLGPAVHHLTIAARLDSSSPYVQTNLGIVRKLMGEPDKALTHFRKALDLKADHAEALANLGGLLLSAGMHEDAERHLRTALAINDKLADAWTWLGASRTRQDDEAEAVECFRRGAELGSRIAAYEIERRSGANPDAPPPEAITMLFDNYASYFDQHLTETLGYRVEAVTDVLAAVAGGRRFDVVLDLGCGTGAAGAVLRGMAKHLVGIDLSTGMLNKARERHVYNELVAADLVAHLGTVKRTDLAFAADVLIYLGNLSPLFRALGRCLAAGGLFAFSIERGEGAGFQLQRSGRYTHAIPYVEALAAETGFRVDASEPVDLRKENGAVVLGQVMVLSKMP